MFNEPLNPALFQQLQRRFGDVGISNSGQHRRVDYLPDPSRPGRMRAVCRERGEQYAINCPFCHDTRHRLYLSYHYGEPDPVTRSGNYGLWLCHNEQCHQDPANQDRLRALTAIPIGRRAFQQGAPVVTVNTGNNEVGGRPTVVSPLPPACSIDSFPASHPAVAYLHGRGFDPAALARDWQIGYCPSANDNSYIASDRIIIPVWRYEHDFSPRSTMVPPLVLGGWLSRGVDDMPDNRPKYMNAPGMKKSKLLYGLLLAVINLTGPVIICEGPTDCWRIGPGAVALFGKTLSAHQKALLVHHFAGRPIIVLLDRDARDEAVGIQLELQRARGLSAGDQRVILLDLPPGRNDPGECTREEIWGVITPALASTTQAAST